MRPVLVRRLYLVVVQQTVAAFPLVVLLVRFRHLPRLARQVFRRQVVDRPPLPPYLLEVRGRVRPHLVLFAVLDYVAFRRLVPQLFFPVE